MNKRWLVIVLFLALSVNSFSYVAFAEENASMVSQNDDLGISELGGYLQGNFKTVSKLADEMIFTNNAGSTAHGFAAEQGSNKYR